MAGKKPAKRNGAVKPRPLTKRGLKKGAAALAASEHVIMLDRYRKQFETKWPITAAGTLEEMQAMTSYEGKPPMVVPKGESEKRIEAKSLKNVKNNKNEPGAIYRIVH
jgi:hypothetical protein